MYSTYLSLYNIEDKFGIQTSCTFKPLTSKNIADFKYFGQTSLTLIRKIWILNCKIIPHVFSNTLNEDVHGLRAILIYILYQAKITL